MKPIHGLLWAASTFFLLGAGCALAQAWISSRWNTLTWTRKRTKRFIMKED